MPPFVDFLPHLCHHGLMLKNVAVLVYEGVAPFELGTLCEAFGLDRSDDGLPRLEFAVCAEKVGTIPTSMGFGLQVEDDLSRVAEADLVAVPARPIAAGLSTAILDAIQQAYDRGARILSVCSGAFVLGEAGLLDGRECTTHWRYTDELQRRFPLAKVVPEVLYVDSGQIITSAGTAAGPGSGLRRRDARPAADLDRRQPA